MTLAFTSPKLVDSGPGIAICQAGLTVSGSYVSGGDTFPDLATLPWLGLCRPEKIVALDIYGQSSVYTYTWINPATPATNTHKMKVQTASAEITAGAYPGAVTSDVIKVVVTLSTAPR